MIHEMKDPIIERKDDLSGNPRGTHEKVLRQREKERHGRFVTVNCKPPTQIFVRDGEDEQKRINAYLQRISNRLKMWN